MKLVLRITMILLAALLVVGGLLALRQSSVGQMLLDRAAFRQGGPAAGFEGRGSGRGRPEGFPALPPAGFEAQRPEGFLDLRAAGFEGRDGQHNQGPSLLGLAEVGKNLGLMAIAGSLIATGVWLVQRGRRERPQPEQGVAQ